MIPSSSSAHGWVIFNKPLHMTSMRAVIHVKRAFNQKKAGHAGTLDPLAYGVLPIALGEATKLIPFAMDKTKLYRFTVKWGEERQTDDLEGDITQFSSSRPSLSEIESILPQFTGIISQKPPAFSAIKIEGKRAFALAREGHDIDHLIKPKDIQVFSLDILDHQEEETTFLAKVSKGTYIRSIARDMGRLLQCYGHVTELERQQVGPFNLNLAITEELLYNSAKENLLSFLLPLETVLDDILALALGEEEAIKFRHGQCLSCHTLPDQPLVKVYMDNLFLGLASIEAERLVPKRVFNL